MSKVIAYGILFVLALCFIVPAEREPGWNCVRVPDDHPEWYDDCVQQGHGRRDGH